MRWRRSARFAPAHNPPYITAMRLLSDQLPEIPLVATFETGFHATIPDRNRYYAVPREWAEEYGVKRWGFHGASHRYIAGRIAELVGRDDLRVISCHLGGSSSLCASRGGQSVATSMGMSPQSGLPQNNRVGDFDPFTLPLVMQRTGKSLEEVLEVLANQSGLLGLSGVGGDIRDVRTAAAEGNDGARLAIGSVHRLGAALPGGVPRGTRRGRCDRLHRRHRRKTARTYARQPVHASKSWGSCSTPQPTNPLPARQRSALPTAVPRFGSSPRMKKSSSPGKPVTY